MGGGRRQRPDTIDYSVGLPTAARSGDSIDGQRPLKRFMPKDEASPVGRKAKAVKAAQLSLTIKRQQAHLRSIVEFTQLHTDSSIIFEALARSMRNVHLLWCCTGRVPALLKTRIVLAT